MIVNGLLVKKPTAFLNKNKIYIWRKSIYAWYSLRKVESILIIISKTC